MHLRAAYDAGFVSAGRRARAEERNEQRQGETGGAGTESHGHFICEAARSMSSAVVMTLELISYERCALIMPIISSTISTLDCSTAPCSSVPRPSEPGSPTCGSPLALVGVSRLCPIACKPAGLTKFAS